MARRPNLKELKPGLEILTPQQPCQSKTTDSCHFWTCFWILRDSGETGARKPAQRQIHSVSEAATGAMRANCSLKGCGNILADDERGWAQRVAE